MIQSLFEFLSLPATDVLHWLLAIAVTLFLFDLFWGLDILSTFALLFFATYVTLYLELSLQLPTHWSIIVFILTLVLAILISTLISRYINAHFTLKDFSNQDLTGTKARLIIIAGEYFIQHDGTLVNVSMTNNEKTACENDLVCVVGCSTGCQYIVEHVEEDKNNMNI